MRQNLSLSQQAVQACHACIESARHLLPAGSEHPHLVLIGARHEFDLELIAARLTRLGIEYRRFYEPDADHSLTALATEPLCADRKRPLKRYQCWYPKADEGECCSPIPIAKHSIEKDPVENMSSQTKQLQSRFGFHPCDKETFLHLKYLHKHYWIALRQFHRWHRWFRKEPQNRHGPEPNLDKCFVEDRVWLKPKSACGIKVYPKTVVDHGILERFAAARKPSAEPVEPFTESELAHIAEMYSKVKEGFDLPLT